MSVTAFGIKQVFCTVQKPGGAQISATQADKAGCTDALRHAEPADDEPSSAAAHPFSLFCRIAWPDEGGHRHDAEGDAAREQEEEEPSVAEMAVNAPVSQHAVPVADCAAAPNAAPEKTAVTEARWRELQSVFRGMASGVEIAPDRTAFTVTLSHALFSGTRLAIRITPHGLDVDYGSDVAAEAEWFDRNAGELARRLSSVMGGCVRVRAKQGGGLRG